MSPALDLWLGGPGHSENPSQVLRFIAAAYEEGNGCPSICLLTKSINKGTNIVTSSSDIIISKGNYQTINNVENSYQYWFYDGE